jgi:ribosome biogenesis protein Nip4
MSRLSIALVVFMLLGGNVYAQELAGSSSFVAEKSSGDEKTDSKQTIEALTPKYAPEDPNAKWRWHESDASIATYFVRSPSRYEVRLSRNERSDGGVKVQIFEKGMLIHEWESNHAEAFVFSEETVVYTHHLDSFTGCTVCAFDLKTKKQIWKTSLTALSKLGERHWSQYGNKINVLRNGNELVVYGNEKHGQYIETINLKTGITVTNTVGPKDNHRF